MLRYFKKILAALLPAPTLRALFSVYHLALAYMGAFLYGRPSRKLLVIAITGTKGKSSTAEFVNAVLEAAGHTTATVNSIRIKIGPNSQPNETGRSMPGRFFLQRTLARAHRGGCTAAVLEMTSEGARQHRHRFLELDALIFTNLAPEHIESHGSFQAYADAKFQIGRELERSQKRPRSIIANADDPESSRYLDLAVENALPFSLALSAPWRAGERGDYFSFDGMQIAVHIAGEFSLRNALAAATLGKALRIDAGTIARGISAVRTIPGRAQYIEAGQNFAAVVDYAYTPDSLKAILSAFGERRKICVLGSAGGGRDTWKRPVLGKIAEEACARVILTNDDPYDDDPAAIINEIASGMKKEPVIVPDRRLAIRRAFELTQEDDVVLITGKGIDPIYGRGGAKLPWNDVEVAREELERLLKKRV